MSAYGGGFALGQGILGGIMGGGQAVAKNADEERKAEMERIKEERMSALRVKEHAANVQTDIGAIPAKGAAETGVAVARQDAMLPGQVESAEKLGDVALDLKKREPRVIAPGATYMEDGDAAYTAPVRTPADQLEYFKAHANYMNAQADAIRNGDRYRHAQDKPQLPSIKVEKDADGNVINVDQNSGAIGTIEAGEPAIPPKSHWFKPDEPGKPAVGPKITWSLNGKPLPNGIEDLYPDMSKSASGGKKGIISSAQGPEQLGGPTESGTPKAADVAKPPKAYPDAQRAPDGKWYVKKGSSWYLVTE